MEINCNLCKRKCPAKLCGRCGAVNYCSKECQIADWSTHKPFCFQRINIDNLPSKVWSALLECNVQIMDFSAFFGINGVEGLNYWIFEEGKIPKDVSRREYWTTEMQKSKRE